VFLNGTKLVPTTDFTATSGTEIVLGTAASSGSNICIVGYGTFSLANFSVGDANDVDLSGISDGDALLYNSTSGNFEAGPLTPAAVSDAANTSTGYFALPAGTTAQRPGSAAAGYTRYNTTTGSLEFYNGTNWVATNLIPSISSITGGIYAGAASTLTLNLINATDTVNVAYYEGSTLLATDSLVTVTSGSATSTVPSAVYGQTLGDTISVSVFNSDGTPSSNSITKTVTALPAGGTITTSGAYRIHTFTSSGTFTNTVASLPVEYLVVAGGGSGGDGNDSGGGGAGGFRTNVSGATSGGGASAEAAMSLSATSYTVTVGAGGARGGSTNGGNSSFNGITSIGGGAGGDNDNGYNGISGGSGGGGDNDGDSAGGSGTSGQGYAGGSGANTDGGGGGGAGEAGTDGGVARGGNGVQSSITGTATYYAGGGGGGGESSSSYAGGLGGGGAGTDGNSATDGTANTGGGGGSVNGTGTGGGGGSGIVIVRYQL